MKKAILMLTIVMPMILMAQNRAPEIKVDRPIIENKAYKYEYVIIRGIIDSEVNKRQEPVSPKKKVKKEETIPRISTTRFVYGAFFGKHYMLVLNHFLRF